MNSLSRVQGEAVPANQNLTGPKWLDIARGYLGVREINGPKHNSTILRFFDDIRAGWFNDDETPWCAAFVGACVEAAGIRSTRSAAALSYLDFGLGLSRPAVGAIAVKKRKGGGHVTFVVGKDALGRLLCLGGNQNDAVTISPYPAPVFAAFRWPGIAPFPYRYDLPLLKADGQAMPSEA